MPKIFVCVDAYLPGYKFGGPVRTVANMAQRLSDEYEFFIFTHDRDHGDSEPFSKVAREQWTQVGRAKVFYTSDRSLRHVLGKVRETSPDIVYLNSFFSRLTMKVLFARKAGLFPNVPILLAPRGEFAPGALVIKPVRKRLYIWLVNLLGLLKDTSLQASSGYEKSDIESHIETRAIVSLDIASNLASCGEGEFLPIKHTPGVLKIIFLARVIRNKNLDGALKMLRTLSGDITFSIYGPIGNAEYWQACQDIVKTLPANVIAKYYGELAHEDVINVLSQHELLFLPTLGENYGHVILEALSAGCPVLISDRTPWRGLEEKGVGADLPLDQPGRFQQVLQKFVYMDEATYGEFSRRAYEYASQCIHDNTPVEQNLKMFSELLKGKLDGIVQGRGERHV